MEAVAGVMLNLWLASGRTDILTVSVLLSLTRHGAPFPSAPRCLFQTSIPYFYCFTYVCLAFSPYSNSSIPKMMALCRGSTRLDRKTDRSRAASPPPPCPVLEVLLLFSVQGTETRVSSKYPPTAPYARLAGHICTLRQGLPHLFELALTLLYGPSSS